MTMRSESFSDADSESFSSGEPELVDIAPDEALSPALPFFVQGHPFPAEFALNPEDPPSAWQFSFDGLHLQPDGRYVYRDQSLTAEQAEALRARMEETYAVFPKEVTEKDRSWETQTRKPTIRTFLFSQCRPLEEFLSPAQTLPKEVQGRFRVNAYGNVLSLQAEPYALTYGDVDHNMPRSRGGSDAVNNLSLVYWHANRHVKKDTIVAAAPDDFWERMNCGVRVEDVRQILEVFSDVWHRKRLFLALEQARPCHLEVVRTSRGVGLVSALLSEMDNTVVRMQHVLAAHALH